MKKTISAKLTCPQCGQAAGVHILWGIPGIAAFEAEQRGELVIAGSDMPPFYEIPLNTQCLSCDVRWNDSSYSTPTQSTADK